MLRTSLARRCAPLARPLPSAALIAHKASMARRLTAKRAELAALETARKTIDDKAYGKAAAWAYAGGAYLFAQTTTLFVWTYDTFDWNLVEPITYLLGYGLVWLSVLLYFCTGRDFTYSQVREIVAGRARDRLCEQNGFDLEAYRRVVAEVSDLEFAVEGLGAVPAEASAANNKV